MKLFSVAYLRLTACYVAIIMVISLLFSVWVYNQAQSELRTGINKVIELKPVDANRPYGAVVDQRLADSQGRLLNQLVLLNAAVLVVGAGASYWLARRTMRPIEEAVEAQERFTADASHELRTPLAAMKAEIEVGLREGKKLSRDDAVLLLQSNLEEVERLGGLAEGLLALTQNDEMLPLKSVELSEIANKAASRVQAFAQTKQIELVSDLQPVQVLGDEATLNKIIGILLDNAIKYSPEKTKIAIRSYQQDGVGVLEIADQGRGIKASELPHIFERFYRADASRSKSQVSGHGLGLSIAQKLAEASQIKITASSIPGKGSVFTLRIPLS